MKPDLISHQYLSYLGIQSNNKIIYNPNPAFLVEEIIHQNEGVLSQTGAVIVETGEHTGRSPNDKFIVDNKLPQDSQIEWGQVNKAISPEKYQLLKAQVKNHLGQRRIYVQDVIAGRDEVYARTFRIVSEFAWAALFSRDLLLPTELNQEAIPDFTILHAPRFFADPKLHGTRSGTFIIINFAENMILIGGTSYAGEIKKSVFTVMNRILPGEDVFPMHCSANIGKKGDTALFFGLSGTGKTTLSSSPDRHLIGDDEHGWSDNGIFNFENGCYAKTINLNKEFEPIIWEASQQFRSVLENVGFDSDTREINFDDNSKTENTRAAYPIEFIEGHVPSGKGGHPKNVFFLSADAFGVLPPIAWLTREQAIYYFLLGYTAKLAGTEKGLGTEPEATFSSCFGEPFLPLSPVAYANMLLKRITQHNPMVWLINTGWSGGPYGIGKRIRLPYSRAMVRAALEQDFREEDFHTDSFFGLRIPKQVHGVPAQILDPMSTWQDKNEYKRFAASLIDKMQSRMDRFSESLDPAIFHAGPKLR